MAEHIHLERIPDLEHLIPYIQVRHPHVALVNFDDYRESIPEGTKITLGFYCIMLSSGCLNKMWYGQNPYDFSDGNMLSIAPRQVLTMGQEDEDADKSDSWGLFFHPDLIRSYPLGQSIKRYSFFGYSARESLHLSAEERQTLRSVFSLIEDELSRGVDAHTQGLIVANIELFLGYCRRFYERQFVTRSAVETDLLSRFEQVLGRYMESSLPREMGLPSVAYLAQEVHLSANYMSDQIKRETGLSPQEHIHHYIIEEAKSRLLSSDVSINDLAYDLGFEYPQYFSRLFRQKVGSSPLAYRRTRPEP